MKRELDSRVVWMTDQLAARGRGSKKALAKQLDIPPDRISEILSGNRRIQLDEWPKITEFFGSSPPDDDLHPAGKPRGVRIMGMLGDDYWVVATKPADERVIGSPVIEYPLEAQSAYEIGGQSKDGSLAKGDVVFTVPFADYRAKPLAGDLLVVRRQRDDLNNYTLQLAETRGGLVILTPYFVGGAISPSDELIELVIGRFSKWPRG